MNLTSQFLKPSKYDYYSGSTRAGSPEIQKSKQQQEMIRLLRLRAKKIKQNQILMEKQFLTYVKQLQAELKNKAKQNQLLKQEIEKQAIELRQLNGDIKIIQEYFLRSGHSHHPYIYKYGYGKRESRIEQGNQTTSKKYLSFSSRLKL